MQCLTKANVDPFYNRYYYSFCMKLQCDYIIAKNKEKWKNNLVIPKKINVFLLVYEHMSTQLALNNVLKISISAVRLQSQ